jgi:hypothetical protein
MEDTPKPLLTIHITDEPSQDIALAFTEEKIMELSNFRLLNVVANCQALENIRNRA